MKKTLVLTAVALTLGACSLVQRNNSRNANPYAQPLFYSRYLDRNNYLDQQIQKTVDALRANPRSAALHNQLGQLLMQKGFPKDAEVEFERAVNADNHYYPSWYNLGLSRAARNDYPGARLAFGRAIHYKPGHSAALFQLGLLEEQRHNNDAAIALYAKALSINHNLLDVKVNPRILDSKLIHLALLKNYAAEHTRESLLFESAPRGYGERNTAVEPQAPSRVPSTEKIITPAAPVTDPSRQTPPPNVPPRTQT